MSEQGKKWDNGKPRWDLLPIRVISDLVDVLTFGAQEYGPNNWKLVRPISRYWAALYRHLAAMRQGRTHDDKSGLPHYAHALCNLVFLGWFFLQGHDLSEDATEDAETEPERKTSPPWVKRQIQKVEKHP